MRQAGTYIMRDQMRNRVAEIMREDVGERDGSTSGPWTPGLLFAGLVLINLLLAGMPS